MEQKVTQEITAKVLNQTAEQLRKQGEFLGLSIGEIIDKMALTFQIDEPEFAAVIIFNYFEMIASNQSDKDSERTLLLIMGFCFDLIMKLGNHTAEDIFETAKSNRNTVREYINKLKEENK